MPSLSQKNTIENGRPLPIEIDPVSIHFQMNIRQ